MKRGLLIAGGTLGGLGTVMSITPPHFSATDSLSMAGLGAISSGAVAAATNSISTSNANTVNTATYPTPAAVATTSAPTPPGVSGTFTGPSVFVQYGNVQVQIKVVNGRITDAQAIVAPSGKSARYTNMAVPVLKKQTLAAQSSKIHGASGASYTSYGWFKSLQGALANAGL